MKIVSAPVPEFVSELNKFCSTDLDQEYSRKCHEDIYYCYTERYVRS